MEGPKNSAEVAIKLIDKARSLKIPVKMESSLVLNSDSRYVILFPGTVEEATIRISSHKAYEPRYALALGVHRPDLLQTAVEVGINWMEKTYGDGKIQAIAERSGLASAKLLHPERGGNGHPGSRGRKHHAGSDHHRSHGVLRGNSKLARTPDALSKRSRGERKRVCLELAGDD